MMHRRHLTDDQKAAAAAAIYHGHKAAVNESRSEKMKGRRNAAKNSGVEINTTNSEAKRTHEKVQEAAGVSERKARQALAVCDLWRRLACRPPVRRD
jgi:catechol-2,3-dioxygenase